MFKPDYSKQRVPFDPSSFAANVDLRPLIASHYLSGDGIEIGALHKPLNVGSTNISMTYVDYKTLAENRLRYPELEKENIVQTDIVDDGFSLGKVKEEAFDFLVANHALEHSPDPVGTLKVWLSKIRNGGYLFIAMPLAEKCYDNGRPITPLSHLQADHLAFQTADYAKIVETAKSHIREFLQISDANIRRLNNMEPLSEHDQFDRSNALLELFKAKLHPALSYTGLIEAHVTGINRNYDIHYHTFTTASALELMQHVCAETQNQLELVTENVALSECISVLKKTFAKKRKFWVFN